MSQLADGLARHPWLHEYAAWMRAQGLSSNTIEQRLKFAVIRLTKWGTLDREPEVVVEWLQGYSGWTRRTYYNHLTSIYAYLVETGALDVSPIARMKSPREPAPRSNPLNAEQMRAVLRDTDERDIRLRAWLLLGFYAGLRAHEIAKVRGEDIDQNQLRVIGKGGVDAVLPTHPDLWEVAQTYPRTGYWFPSPHRARDHVSAAIVSNTIRAHFRAHGITDGACHRTRHTYGTRLARAGVQPRVVQDLLRHASLDTTMRYIAVSDEERWTAIRTVTL